MKDLLSLIAQARDENWEELDLSGMGLTELPIEIGILTGLKRLVLGKLNHGDSFTEIPEVVFKLKQLEELLIADNQITEIPESIAQLTNLTWLDLGNNQITEIPDSIAQLTNLTLLHLDSNQITKIPDSIAQLNNLILLVLYNNQITKIPDSIGQLINLTKLHLSSNQIVVIPNSIAQLTNLQRLVLEENPIQNVPLKVIRKGWGEKIYQDGKPQIIFVYLQSIKNDKCRKHDRDRYNDQRPIVIENHNHIHNNNYQE